MIERERLLVVHVEPARELALAKRGDERRSSTMDRATC